MKWGRRIINLKDLFHHFWVLGVNGCCCAAVKILHFMKIKNFQGAQQVAEYIGVIPWNSILQRSVGIGNLLFLILCAVGPQVAPVMFSLYYLFVHFLFALNLIRGSRAVYKTFRLSVEHSKTDWAAKYCNDAKVDSVDDPRHDVPFSSIMHHIFFPNYKEEIEMMKDTLDVLASHDIAKTNYKVCLAMEESEAGASQKAETLCALYSHSFYSITYTIHPVTPSEARGKASNVNFAIKQVINPYSSDIVTIMDSDTCFAQDYFTAISYHYATASRTNRKLMMFHAPIIFDR
jgi:hypothetical protein